MSKELPTIKIEKVIYGRKYPIGPYEMESIAFEATVIKGDPLEVLVSLRGLAEIYIKNREKQVPTIKEHKDPVPDKRTPEEEELLNHTWKGKRKANGEGHEKGSLEFGWDWVTDRDGKLRFSESTIQLLRNAPIIVEGTQFSLTEDGKRINVGKVKKK